MELWWDDCCNFIAMVRLYISKGMHRIQRRRLANLGVAGMHRFCGYQSGGYVPTTFPSTSEYYIYITRDKINKTCDTVALKFGYGEDMWSIMPMDDITALFKVSSVRPELRRFQLHCLPRHLQICHVSNQSSQTFHEIGFLRKLPAIRLCALLRPALDCILLLARLPNTEVSDALHRHAGV
jgi:hypothetical protein